jgi:hypothetical protein
MPIRLASQTINNSKHSKKFFVSLEEFKLEIEEDMKRHDPNNFSDFIGKDLDTPLCLVA